MPQTVQPDIQHVQPAGALAGVLYQLSQRGSQDRSGGQAATYDMEEHFLQMYLNEKLETVSCLKFWEKQDHEYRTHKFKGALCRLARYKLSSI